MYLSKLIIKGFRSFDAEGSELLIKEKLVGFIGMNSSGKSAAIDSLRKLFGNSSYEKELVREDFHVEKENPDATERELTIEACINFDEDDANSIAHFFSHLVIEEEGANPYARICLEGKWSDSIIDEAGLISTKLFFIKVPYGEEIQETDKFACQPHIKSLFQIIYIPAIRKPDEQLRYASGSIFYRVLKKISWTGDFKVDFDSKMTEVTEMFEDVPEFQVISKTINSYWKKFHKDKRYETASLTFGGNDYEAILRKLEVSFDPSGVHRPYSVKDLGDGYRSLFYITLVCALLNVEETLVPKSEEIGQSGPLLTLLAVEEPENHIAPQLLGRVINNLTELSKGRKSQIILSSHTPAIVQRIKPEAIFHFRIDLKHYKTVVKTIRLPKKADEAYKYIKEAIYNYPEIYFAKMVVIGEGDSEAVLFKRLAKVYGIDFDDNMITFVPLGHRFVNHIWRLLKALDIQFITLLDLDMEREGGGWGRIKYIIDQLLAIRTPAKDVVTLQGGKVLTADEIEEINGWSLGTTKSVENLLAWANSFNKFNVYYSSPLDLDFLLLKAFTEAYKKTIPTPGGPRIPDKTKKAELFTEKVKTAVEATLKSEKATGENYSEDDKELMIYYNYLFLGRGKPSTHILAFSELTDEEFKAGLPKELRIVVKKIFELSEIPYEEDTI